MKPLSTKFIALLTLLFGIQTLALANHDLTNHEQQTVSFSQILPANITIKPTSGFTSQSNEYWFKATGAQLNKGVKLNFSANEALIRITNTSAAKLNQEASIDVNYITLVADNSSHKTFAYKGYNQKQLNHTLFSNSSALAVTELAGSSNALMKVNYHLPDNQSYLINVKEKHSPYLLQMHTDKQVLKKNELLQFTAKITQGSKILKTLVSASIKLPNGQYQQVALHKHGQKFSVKLPEHFTTGKPGELYELYTQSMTSTPKGIVKRNGKIAFAITPQTANIHQISTAMSQLNINLNVVEPGRFQASTIIYGTNNQNQLVPALLSQTATNLPYGEQILAVDIDPKKLARTKLKAPFVVKSIKLVDQTRLALLATKAVNIPFNVDWM